MLILSYSNFLGLIGTKQFLIVQVRYEYLFTLENYTE